MVSALLVALRTKSITREGFSFLEQVQFISESLHHHSRDSPLQVVGGPVTKKQTLMPHF